MKKRWMGLLLAVAVLVLAGCGGGDASGGGYEDEIDALTPVPLGEGERLQVVATTNIVGDVVRNVGGERIDLDVLMGIGVDPHSYVATPSDTAAIHDAHVVLANGAGLEARLETLFESAGGETAYIHLSEELDLLPLAGGEAADEGDHGHEDADPHVWFSVPNTIQWVDSIRRTLSALDPENAAYYEERAGQYRQTLEALDAWIEEQVATIPEGRRKLVTNHPVFGYFAQRYGLEQVGAIYPISPSGEPSAQDVARLVDAIRQYDVPAVFAESTVNPKLAEQVANDTGIRLVPLYTGSLGEAGSGAETYVEMMEYDVRAIVEALK